MGSRVSATFISGKHFRPKSLKSYGRKHLPKFYTRKSRCAAKEPKRLFQTKMQLEPAQTSDEAGTFFRSKSILIASRYYFASVVQNQVLETLRFIWKNTENLLHRAIGTKGEQPSRLSFPMPAAC